MDIQPSITVAVQGRYPIDRAALEALVSLLPGFELVPPTAEPPPRVLLWLPGDADCAQPPTHAPRTAVLTMTTSANGHGRLPDTAGLLTREEPLSALIIAIQQLARGGSYYSSILSKDCQQQTDRIHSDTLTPREHQVLELLTQGLSNRKIATHLQLSVRTVEGHLTNLYAKLGVHCRTEAALMAVQNGFSEGASTDNGAKTR